MLNSNEDKKFQSLVDSVRQMMSNEEESISEDKPKQQLTPLTEDDGGDGGDSGYSWADYWAIIKTMAPIIGNIITDRINRERELQLLNAQCDQGIAGACRAANDLACEMGLQWCETEEEFCESHPNDPACAPDEEEDVKPELEIPPRTPTIDPEGGPVPDWGV